MTLTVDLNPDAVWQDGSPITVADIECSWRAAANTPGSVISGQGYNLVTAVTEGESDKQAIIEFSQVYGPYKTMFDRIIQAVVRGELRRHLRRLRDRAAAVGSRVDDRVVEPRAERRSCRTLSTGATRRSPSAS